MAPSSALRVALPELASDVVAASPGVRLQPEYGGNVGVSYWSVEGAARVIGGGTECSFVLPVRDVPRGAIVLTGNGAGVDRLQVGNFGVMREAQALAAAEAFGASLRGDGWVPNLDVVVPTRAQRRVLLRGGSGVTVSDLRCGAGHVVLSVERGADTRWATYSFVYDVMR